MHLWQDLRHCFVTNSFTLNSSSEHVCSVIGSMLRNLKSQQRTRLLNKFTENDCEKVDRLMELYFKFLEAVQQADKRIEGEKHVRIHLFILFPY
ncbi:Beta-catenin-like protein 1 [Ataeniobius toweri]|uniref:Beta-catenin-like protein 1 n=1 Tax=Ataeniobius toweri TaxID=208326 RepID=A0ABU7BG10_9TELE|nr:Beta-catenin-like protein 1 [Ataeniobius toweri]